MAQETLEQAAIEQLGDPGQVARELASFRKAARSLSSNHPRYIEKYPKQWVIVHNGAVKVRGQSMQSALLQAREQNLPVQNAILRYIDRNDRTFIL